MYKTIQRSGMATKQNRNALLRRKKAKHAQRSCFIGPDQAKEVCVPKMVRESVVLRELVEWHARKVVRRDAGLALGDLLWTIFFGPVVLLFKSSQRSSQSIVKSRTLS